MLNISGEQAEEGKETQSKVEELDETPVTTSEDELKINEDETEEDEGKHYFNLDFIHIL